MNAVSAPVRQTTTWSRPVYGATIAIGCAMVAYHMASTQWIILTSYAHQDVHLIFALLLVFVPALAATERKLYWLATVGFLVLGLAAAAYVGLNIDHLQTVLGFPDPVDVAVGVVLIVVVLEATRRAWGSVLPIVAIVSILYFFFGDLIPGPLSHRPFAFDYVVSYMSIGLTGIYGSFLSISANQIFLFVVFGSMFKVLGIESLLAEVGKLVGRRMRSGPALMAVVSSSLVGMITGASVANVAVTGAFTIPYMKRAGYSPDLAGGIEATASTGGQIMPPVMGAAAFLMAFFIGVPYVDVMIAGIVPAVLFYLGVFASVHFASVQGGIDAPTEAPKFRIIFVRAPAFLLPLGVIIALLLRSYSPDVAAFWAIITATVVAFAYKDRPDFAELIKCLVDGAVIGARIAVSLTVVGMIAQTLISTGLGSKIAGLIDLLSAGNIFLALLMTMAVSIILGCGVPPAAAYSLVAITAAPTLVRLGLPPLSAHFFAFYFAIMSALTPPVALGALAASAIAGGNYFTTSVKAFKLALSGFIVPFFIVFNPIARFDFVGLAPAVGAIIAMPISLIALSAALYGHALRRLTVQERVAALLAAAAAFGFTIFRQFASIPLEYPMLIIAVVIFGWFCFSQLRGETIPIAAE
jgi:TRAP transporter 4TM/12TM fusion protein